MTIFTDLGRNILSDVKCRGTCVADPGPGRSRQSVDGVRGESESGAGADVAADLRQGR